MNHHLFTEFVYLTNKQLEMHRCILSTLGTDALLLKHQAISTHSAEKYSLCWTSFIQKYRSYRENIRQQDYILKKKYFLSDTFLFTFLLYI